MGTQSCFLLLGLCSVVLASCPRPYRRISKYHSYCREPTKLCDMHENYPMTAADAQEIVRAHNELRSKVATGKETIGNLPQAADMLEMQWDEELAESARRWAGQCRSEHDPNTFRMTGDYWVGQNIAEFLKKNWTEMVHRLYNEVENFDPTVIDDFKDPEDKTKVYGHFTQVIWAKTWRVGCGFVNLTVHGYNYTSGIMVCNYGPASNRPDAPVYKRGQACSQCPWNTCCGNNCKKPSYPGLCQVQDDKIPIYPRRPADLNYLYFCNFTNMESCNITMSKTKPWTISNSLTGKYIGIVLNKGEESYFEVGTAIKNVLSTCWAVYYRKGREIAEKKSGNKAFVFLNSVQEKKPVHDIELPHDSILFYRQNGIVSGALDYTLFVKFNVTEDAQYFEIREISVHEGRCLPHYEYD